jgi:putative thioredoxin
MRYGIQGIPAVKAFRDGQIVDDFVGAQPEPMVRQFIEGIAPSAAGEAVISADKLLEDRQWQEAESLFREKLELDPDGAEAKLGLAKSLLGQGDGCKARFYLEELKSVVETMDHAERLLPLAEYLCIASEIKDKNAEVTVVEAQYRQAARLFSDGKYAPALDGLLDVLRHNKNYRDGQAKAVVLGIFELLGDEDPLTQVYRRELGSILF